MNQRDQKTKRFTMNDLTGQRFGMLTALEPLEERDQGRVVWRCRCDCGKIVLRYSSQLKAGVKTNCGCTPVNRIREDLAGQRFGSLTVIKPTEKRSNKRIVWECRCDCGNTAFVQTQYLKDGSTKSCKTCQKENRPKRDIAGQRFGILTALYPTDKRDRNQSVIWHCRCDCGNEVDHSCADLQRKSYISCGCLKRAAEEKLKDQTTHVAGTTVELLRNKRVRNDSTTGVTGVNMYRGKYKAMIHFQKKTYCLGTYRTLEEAASVRKEAEECLYGEFLSFYEKWNEKASANPEWAADNPVSFVVNRDETGNFHISMSPFLT
ncbi:MAG: transcriptional regulator [Lachnospiraceae bacterium]|nr:transcriptional regulator [Lachnospiraceae bacterium]